MIAFDTTHPAVQHLHVNGYAGPHAEWQPPEQLGPRVTEAGAAFEVQVTEALNHLRQYTKATKRNTLLAQPLAANMSTAIGGCSVPISVGAVIVAALIHGYTVKRLGPVGDVYAVIYARRTGWQALA